MFVFVLPVVLCSGAAGAAAQTPRGDPGGRLGIRLIDAPVIRRKDPRARSYIVDHLAPGTVIHRRIQVSNISARAQHVDLYATAAGVEQNRFVFAPERTPNELTTWAALDRPQVDLAPHGSRIVNATIRVPKSAWHGERYAVIWAQEIAKPDHTHNLGLINRVGIRIYLDVGAGGEPPSDFRIERLTPMRDAAGKPQIIAQVHNTGGRALDMSGALSLREGPGGLKAGPFPATTGVTLLPDHTAPVSVLLDKRIPAGPWKVRLTLSSGLVKRTATATVTFPPVGIGKSHQMGFRWLVPLLIALFFGLLIAVIIVLIRRSRSRPS